MGNVPAKEERRRSSSSATARSIQSSLNTLKKSKKTKEKELEREAHYMDLVVKYAENVDGGYLAPYGTYKSNLDFKIGYVKELIKNRKISPFYTPLQDFNDSWTDDELFIILNQLTLHSIDDAYEEDEDEKDDIDDHKLHKTANFLKKKEQKLKLKMLIDRTKEVQKNEQMQFDALKTSLYKNESEMDVAKTKNIFSKELYLYLYKNCIECPICFLYYPKYLNMSRCCLQPICSECFVQIKRLDPHPPHDDEDGEPSEPSEDPEKLISEPANCPFCASPNFGITYTPPLFQIGIGGISPQEFSSDNLLPEVKESRLNKRRGSLAANSPGVITVDMVRPDWEQKLINARSKLARKSAAATAIHASNLLLNGEGRFGRRNNSASLEERMIEEALKLSLIEEQERNLRRRQKAEEKK